MKALRVVGGYLLGMAVLVAILWLADKLDTYYVNYRNPPIPSPSLSPTPTQRSDETPCGEPREMAEAIAKDARLSNEPSWRKISASEDYIFYYDAYSTRCEDKILYAWIKVVATKGKKYATGECAFDCLNNKYQQISNTHYDENGNPIKSESYYDMYNPDDWNEVKPFTVFESVLGEVCYKPR